MKELEMVVIPIHASIKRVIFEIRLVDPLDATLNSGEYQGMIDYVNQRIYVANNLSEGRLKEVLTHELTHAFLNKYKHQKKSYTEEDVCELFEMFAEDIVSIVENIMLRLDNE